MSVESLGKSWTSDCSGLAFGCHSRPPLLKSPTNSEYELLRGLSVEAGRVVTYDALKRQIWGERDSDDTNLVRTFIRQLRRKLGDDPREPPYIFNQRVVGYRMAKSDKP